jgi:hypothetical protein
MEAANNRRAHLVVTFRLQQAAAEITFIAYLPYFSLESSLFGHRPVRAWLPELRRVLDTSIDFVPSVDLDPTRHSQRLGAALRFAVLVIYEAETATVPLS